MEDEETVMAAPLDASKGGRPLLFKTVKELEDVIDEYFKFCDARVTEVYVPALGENVTVAKPAPYTMSGLARRLGISRQALSEYSQRELFGDTIKKARDRVQEDIETRLLETSNQAGAIFNLKNNFGWKDKSEVDQNVNLPIPLLGGASVYGIPDHDGTEETLPAQEEN